jgi:hypothetical protein
MKMAKQKWNPVAKNLHKFHKPKRIEDKRYKETNQTNGERNTRSKKHAERYLWKINNVKNVNNIYL